MSTNIKYVVNPEKKTVVCLLEGCKDDVYNAMSPSEQAIVLFLHVNCELNNKYIGVAKCDPEDTFDEEFGRKLARNRMLKKYYRDRAYIYYNIKECVDTFSTRFFKYSAKYSNMELEKSREIIEQLNEV